MKINFKFFPLLIFSILIIASNCFATEQQTINKDLQKSAEEFVKEKNLQKDFDVLQKSALRGDFDKIDPSIKKDFLDFWELMNKARSFSRKAKLSYEIADDFNKAGFQQLIFQHNNSEDFNNIADKEIEKIRKINPKTYTEKEELFRKVALSGKFDRFDVTIRKFFENSNKELLEAKKYDKESQDLYLLSKKKQSQGFDKIMKISPEKLGINNFDQSQE